MKQICAGLLAVLLLILSGCSSAGTAPPAVNIIFSERAYISYSGEYQPGPAPEGMELAAQKGYTAMFFAPETADFVLEDMRTGERYYSVSPNADGTMQERSHLLVADVDLESDSLKTKYSANANVTAQKTENGFQAWYAFMEEKYAIPVEYSLCEDGLRVRIRCDQILEQGNNQIFSVSLLPFFYAQSGHPDGFILVPDGSGAIIRLDADKTAYSPYTGSLYGDSYLTPADYVSSVTENCLLPFTGMQGKTGGFLAMAENGAANGNIEAAAEGQNSSYSHTYFTFDLRRRQNAVIGNAESANAKTVVINESGPIAITDISVRYFLLDSMPENGLAKMAETARNIAADQAGKISPAADSALYLTTLGGFTAEQPVLGFRTKVTRTVTSFEAAADMVKQLREDGADRISLIYTGYNRTALRGGLTGELKPDRAVGSLGELSALSELLGSQRLLMTADPVAFQKNGGGISKNRSTIRDLNKATVAFYPYKRNTFQANKNAGYYLLKTDLAAELIRQSAEWLAQEIPDAGLLVAGFGEKLYGDYSQNGYTREQALQNVRETLRQMSESRPVYSQEAFYDAALYSSAVVNVPASSSGYDVLDENVPFYQMVFSGVRQIISRPINWSGDPEQAFLNCVRFGMIPHYELIAQEQELPGSYGLESFHAAAFLDWGPEITERFQQYLPVFEAVNGRTLLDYQTAGEGLYQLTYSGGVRLLVNQSAKAVQLEGQTVEPDSFAVIQ